MCHFNFQLKASIKMFYGSGAGTLLLPAMLTMLGVCSLSFAQIPVDLTGKVTTKQGTAAFDIVMTLLDANVSDTSDTAGNYRLFRQGTGTFTNGQPVSRQRTDIGIIGKTVSIGGRGSDRPGPGDAIVFDICGRAVGPARLLSDHSGVRLSDGIYFLYRGAAGAAASTSSRKVLAAASDTISLSYQGTFLKKVSVATLTGTFNIALDADLPARKHSVLVSSYSNNKAYILSATNQVEWEYAMPGPVQDAWLLPSGNILLCGGGDVREVTRAKEQVWKYSASAGEIHNCYPLPGNVVLLGENVSGKILEINRTSNTVLRTIQTQCQGDNHTRFRMVRKTRDSTYLVAARGENNVYELSKTGAVLRKVSCDTLKKKYGINWDAVHSALKLDNGNILIGGGYNSVFIELDSRDSMVWKLSAADIPEIGFDFAAAGQILPGGTFVFGAYTSTYKLVEVTRAKKVLWKLQNSAIGNPTHAYVIDCWETGGAAACVPVAPETLMR